MGAIKSSTAGSLESSDVLITIIPSGGRANNIEIESIVYSQFGARIKRVAAEVVGASGISGATIRVQDRGALECTLRARLETALERALKG